MPRIAQDAHRAGFFSILKPPDEGEEAESVGYLVRISSAGLAGGILFDVTLLNPKFGNLAQPDPEEYVLTYYK